MINGGMLIIPSFDSRLGLRLHLRLPQNNNSIAFRVAALVQRFCVPRMRFSCPRATAATVGRNGVAIHCEDRCLFREDR